MTYWEKNLPDHLTIQKNKFGLPVFEPRPSNVAELLRQTVTRVPEETALVFQEKQMTYLELWDQVCRVAFNLQNKYGIKKGEKVALLLGNGFLYPICFFALAHIGAISVPLNVRLSPTEIEYEIVKSKARLLITEKEYWEGIYTKIQCMDQLDEVFVSEKTTDLEKLFSELTEPFVGDIDVPVIIDTEPCSIFFTSGTTGHPKGALLTHLGFVSTGMNFAVTYQLQPKDSTLMMVPMFHITGMLQFLGAIYTGIPVYILKSYQTETVLELLQRYKPTILVGVPTMYWFMLSSQKFRPEILSNVRAILYGGAPAPFDLIEKLRKIFPQMKIHNGYGLTEGHGLDTLLPDQDALRKHDSVGLPVPLVEVKVVDENGNGLPTNGIGELIIRGPKVISGYWENEEASNKAIRNGWLYTGDVAKIDDEGYVYILDRIKDMINRAGEKVYSIEVENVLYSFPKVLEAAVVGIPDKIFGEQIKAVIVLKPGMRSSSEEIRKYCLQKLAHFKVPKVIEFLDKLPRNPSGKVLKRQLV
ncbi:class I adenylate-forming enzyme family protein [Neobacillus sp. 114]|uniref:class I adenylate-forming enzyme family protein n=1 Tax=Neobacillus sp. 114 TaxID=3048535 RepID=UPI0024C4283A|nr:class I adenylate-forming enzyme family protein [Neobacillus sp. 114]